MLREAGRVLAPAASGSVGAASYQLSDAHLVDRMCDSAFVQQQLNWQLPDRVAGSTNMVVRQFVFL